MVFIQSDTSERAQEIALQPEVRTVNNPVKSYGVFCLHVNVSATKTVPYQTVYKTYPCPFFDKLVGFTQDSTSRLGGTGKPATLRHTRRL